MLNPRSFYTLALWLLLPYVFLRLAWRAREQPEYLRHIGERFGFYSEQSDRPVIWLHTVSVGETRAAQSLIIKLRATYPDHQILLTHTTPTGRAASEQLYGDGVLRVYLPYDYPFSVNRFLRHFRPQFGILMETEIWFNLIHACRETGVPLLLLNARMSEKSARNYARFERLTRDALNGLAAIAAQTADDAARLADLGAQNVTVTGNLKFDIAPPPAMLELGKQLRAQFGSSRRVFLAASTRDGEEALLLDALEQVHIPGLLMVIVPRHPQRFSQVAALLEQRGIPFRRRSEIGKAGEPQNREVAADIKAVLGDSMGEMFAYYAAADLAFVGGSLLPYGGQNLIEACAAGAPVVVGPHTHNFAEATRLAVAAGAAAQVQDNGGLVMELQRLLDNPDALCKMQRRCAGFVEANRGATEKSLLVILSALSANQSGQ
ncbi:MAG: 3-deoxy-D-manno-octulosonic acid transferase [Gallionellales bacterium RIFCSPLOWO2_02_FULL_57_47]|nr:MAG: 3-deoxy-D-manno-octulosonic acid transferase [Gallionellales bacterium RIFCSPLOWO2_02_FULL_57_47]